MLHNFYITVIYSIKKAGQLEPSFGEDKPLWIRSPGTGGVGDWLEGHPDRDLSHALGWTSQQFCGDYGHNLLYLRYPAPEDNPDDRPCTLQKLHNTFDVTSTALNYAPYAENPI